MFLTILLAALGGSIVGLSLMAGGHAGRRTALPFGTFLAPAAVLIALAGPALWRWYTGFWGTGS